ncbi:unnamed protein product [Auanema sp. JU1783]|nr:unnamed protein product [Auanema sp. JU1783]
MGSGHSQEQKVQSMGRLQEDRKLYRLVDMHGGGELIPWFRYALTSGDTSILDAYIDTKVRDFMYNQGKGKVCTVTELVKLRNKERNERLGAFSRKKGKGKSGPNVLDDFNQEGENVGDLKKALKLLDGGGKGGKGESKYRDITWKLDERGSMGETIIGICLLQGTDMHNKLALKILDSYPKLVNDINVSEDYYGLTLLHQSIVNQDVKMAYTLLKRGADVSTRCYGAFFCADDQKATRTDSLEHEYVELSAKTNYTGTMYFGEYPLSFAACMNQPDCYRLLLAKKANPNAQDTNGNTVLHMCVIHENMNMFRVALENGASLRMTNKQNLTPLTLAAKMAKEKMFTEILEIEGERVWAYGDASSTAYPLAKIDTINEVTGDLNENSALSLVVYGETPEHLELLDGLLEELLEEKWKAFGKAKLAQSVLAFSLHWSLVTLAFFLRPISLSTSLSTDGWITKYGYAATKSTVSTDPSKLGTPLVPFANGTYSAVPWNAQDIQCHLLNYASSSDWENHIRLAAEMSVLLSVMIQMFLDVQDIRYIGASKWWNILKAFPAKIAYKTSFLFILFTVIIRSSCRLSAELVVVDNILACITVLMTTIHFLFYCRAINFVGPFVLMVYTIIATDIRRFIFIYGIFLVGFSQAFYLVFLSCERVKNEAVSSKSNATYLATLSQIQRNSLEQAIIFENVIQGPVEAFIRTFILTIGEFTVLYRNLALCPANIMVWIGKSVFLIFEMGVSILQFNLLIAMMTRTYEAIFRTKKEYKRQWAQVILMLELSLSPSNRLMYLLKYSRPTGTNKRARSLVVNTKITEEEKNSLDGVAKTEEKLKRAAEEKKAIIKWKLKDMEQKESNRPTTSFNRTPRPVSRR